MTASDNGSIEIHDSVIEETYNEKKDAEFYVSHVDLAASISKEKLEEIAPNGEYEYILEKIANMSDEEALEIVTESIEYFSDDWNFPAPMMAEMKRLVQGPKIYGDNYERDLKINAVLIRHSSPYPEVRAIGDPTDDMTIPVETFRAYFIGIAWSCLGTCCNTFFNSRFPGISVNTSVIQIFLYPCGKFFEKVLPDWGFTFRGTRHSLNSGPWTYKEQMFATIIYSISGGTTNCYTMILVQKNKMFYGNDWADTGYQVMLTIFSQLFGISLAGMMRRFSVYPMKAIWPTVLPRLAMNRALLRPEIKENINGWTISRYSFFYLSFLFMFLYYWIPGYLFTSLSNFNWMTWIAPNNMNLAVITGGVSGMGLNPWPTFDWNVMTNSYAALSTPFFSVGQMYIGSVLGMFVILGMWYTNQYWTSYMPINTTTAFANDGTSYTVSKVLKNGIMDQTLYQNYSPPFYSAGYLLTTGANFVFYPVYFLYIMFNQWRIVKTGYVDFYKGIRYGKKNYESNVDHHSRLMAKYPEAPDWWFLVLLVFCIVLAIIFVEIYPLDTPVWLIFLLIAINIAFMVPLTLLTATTGTNFGLGNILQIITGYALPNNPQAFIFSQTIAGWGMDGRADTFCLDQKMAHYAKLPPRAAFRGQLLGVIITSFVAIGIQNWIFNNIDGLCEPDQPDHFTCAGDGYPLYTESLMWGLLGSKRVINGLYPILKWCWLIGFLLAIFFLVFQYLGARYGEFVYAKWERELKPGTFNILKKTIIPLGRLFMMTNPVLIVTGVQHWAPSNLAYKTTGVYLCWLSMYYLRRRYTAWWEKYNYVLSAAFTAGIPCCALVIYFATSYHPKKIHWWGNSVSSAGIDGKGARRLAVPERGYFGPDRGTFP